MAETNSDSNPLNDDDVLTIDRRIDVFEDAWQRGEPIEIEQALEGLEGATRAACLAHALAVELEYRRQRGDSPVVEEYLARFPDMEAVIQKAFADIDALPAVAPSSSEGEVADSDAGLTDLLGEATSSPDELSTLAVPPKGEGGSGDRAPDAPNRYLLFEKLGQGGMGAVHRARDAQLGRELAFKVLLNRHADHAAFRDRFVEEAQIGGQLQHPGIVPIYELGQLGDARPYFTMKLIEGRTLGELLKERELLASGGRQPPDPATRARPERGERASGLRERTDGTAGDRGRADSTDQGADAPIGIRLSRESRCE